MDRWEEMQDNEERAYLASVSDADNDRRLKMLQVAPRMRSLDADKITSLDDVKATLF